MTAKKNFNELTPAGQKARLAKYAEQRAQYGLLNGLFRITTVSDHGEAMVTNPKDGTKHKVRRFGYRVVTAGAKHNEEGLADGTWMWFNEMINVTDKSQQVIDARLAIADKLANGAKSVLVSIDYKKKVRGNNTYRDVNSLFERTSKKQQAQQPAQPQPNVTEDSLPM